MRCFSGYTQVFFRRALAEKLSRLVSCRNRSAARTMQRCARLRPRRLAATRIQALLRGVLRRTRPLDFVQLLAEKMDHDDKVAATIELLETQMAAAVDEKNFGGCALLQQKLDDAKSSEFLHARGRALTKAVGRARVSASRPAVEIEIVSVQLQVDDACAAKEFRRCNALQWRLDALENARSELSTSGELKRQTSLLQAQISEAVKLQEFDKCTELQLRLDETRDRASSICHAGDDDDDDDEEMRRPVLRAKLERLHAELRSYMEAKQFARCESVQAAIAKTEQDITSLPSPAELAARIPELEQQVISAKSAKDWGAAAAASVQLQKLNVHKRDAEAAYVPPAQTMQPAVRHCPCERCRALLV